MQQKVLSYTPAWLSKPNPGHEIFTAAPAKPDSTFSTQSNGSSSASKRSAKPGPRRTIARRGTEVFIAVGKEIRWADLVYLKEAWEDKETTRKTRKGKERHNRESVATQYSEDHAQGYRVGPQISVPSVRNANYSRPSKPQSRRTFDS
jgi:nucleoporin NUP82